MTLGELIKRDRQNYPDKIAIKYRDKQWTYRELEADINRMANGLKKLGITKGDRVGLLMLNSSYFVISYFGIVTLGAVVVPVNVMFKGGEVAYLMDDARAAALITAPMFMPMVGEIRDKLQTVKHIILQDADLEEPAPDTISMTGILKGESEEPTLDYTVSEEDAAVFLYTSGTTGNPKGAMLTHKNLVSNAASTAEATESTSDDITLCVLPMFHSFAWTCCVSLPIYCGGTIVVLETFIPQVVLKTLVEERITVFAGVPTMYGVLLQAPAQDPADFAHIRLSYSGGASLPVEILKKVDEKFGIKILEGYGLSECSPVCTVNPYKDLRKPGSIGKVIPRVECRIVDDAGNEVPRNTPGELLFRGPNVMLGYYNLPEATAEALKDGWMHTGDIGYMDDEEYIFIIDRKKDLIIVGGLNVYPREIEEVLYTHPKVAEAAVIGEPDQLRGEVVKAVIALKKDETATEREIIRYCQERLANYKLPKMVQFVEALPKTSTGKILKRALKQ